MLIHRTEGLCTAKLSKHAGDRLHSGTPQLRTTVPSIIPRNLYGVKERSFIADGQVAKSSASQWLF